MSRAVLEQVVSLLGSLSLAELEQLSAKVAALRALSGPAPSNPRDGAGLAADDQFGGLLYEAIAWTLSSEQGTQQQPFGTFTRSKAGAAFLKAAAAAGSVHAVWFPKATRAQTAALCRIYARSLLNYLEAKHKPLQWPVISSSLADLPEVLSHAFPGYARSGMMSMLSRVPVTALGGRESEGAL